MKVNKLRISVLSIQNPTDKRTWSGIPYYILKNITPHFKSVKILEPFKDKLFLLKLKNKLREKIINKRIDFSHSKELAYILKEHFEKQIKTKDSDLIVSIVGSTATAYLDTQIPIVHISDATFAKMINYYPAYSNLSKKSIEEGNEIEKMALSKSLVNIFPSEWAFNSAIKDYGIDKSKNYLIPFGANIDEDPIITFPKKMNEITLLFLGVDWIRKGGDDAVSVFNILKKRNLPVKLIVCGCLIPKDISDKNIINIPYLNKNNPNEYSRFQEILSEANFLLLPTKAECYGIVFCEASAFGIPSLAYNTGGVSSVIHNNINGFTFTPNNIEKFAEKIEYYFNHQQEYQSLCISTKNLYNQKLNWNAWTERFISVLNNYL